MFERFHSFVSALLTQVTAGVKAEQRAKELEEEKIIVKVLYPEREGCQLVTRHYSRLVRWAESSLRRRMVLWLKHRTEAGAGHSIPGFSTDWLCEG